MSYLQKVLRLKGHAVVVVAEGAGEELLSGKDAETDASGQLHRSLVSGFRVELGRVKTLWRPLALPCRNRTHGD